MNVRSYLIRDELNGPRALSFAAEVAGHSMAGVRAVELSFASTSEIDVAGLAVLVRLFSQLNASGRALVLTDVPARVSDQFQALGLGHMIAKPPRPVVGWRLPQRRRAFA